MCAGLATSAGVYGAVGDASAGSPAGTERASREPTEREKDLLHSAEQRLLRDCMRRAGFEYEPTPLDSGPRQKEFPYVIDDPEWAAKHGYGSDLAREAEKARQTDPNQRYFRSLPAGRRAEALKAVNGPRPVGMTAKTPDGSTYQRSDEGCQTESERKLYGNVEEWFQAKVTTDSLQPLRVQKVLKDPRFTKATRPWAECMRKAGHDFATPMKLRESLPSARNPMPKKKEIRLAVDEADCARSSGLARRARWLDSEYDRELRRKYRSELETRRRLQLAAIPRADSILEKSGAES